MIEYSSAHGLRLTRAHTHDAGFDLCTAVAGTIPVGQIKPIDTGIRVAFPPGTFGFICSRSGLSMRGVVVANAPGVVDHGYRGEIIVVLANWGQEPFHFDVGDRVAQLVPMYIGHDIDVKFVEHIFEHTDRGQDGLGSTGVEEL